MSGWNSKHFLRGRSRQQCFVQRPCVWTFGPIAKCRSHWFTLYLDVLGFSQTIQIYVQVTSQNSHVSFALNSEFNLVVLFPTLFLLESSRSKPWWVNVFPWCVNYGPKDFPNTHHRPGRGSMVELCHCRLCAGQSWCRGCNGQGCGSPWGLVSTTLNKRFLWGTRILLYGGNILLYFGYFWL